MDLRVLMSLLFVLCGTFNVLIVKWADNQLGVCSDGKWRTFQHPVVLTMLMFMGELLCFGIYKLSYFLLQRPGLGSENEHILTRGGREFSPLSMLFPSLLDAVATLLLFTGLYLTYASSFQMIRGIALIFVGLFSTIYLNQALSSRHWLAMFTIVCGITAIMSIDVQRIEYDHASLAHADYNAVLTGDLLIILAQILHAMQYVYEEKHLKAADLPPLQVVGWQGIFGCLITALFGICLHFTPSPIPFNENSHEVFDDLSDLLPQLRSNIWLALGLFGFMLSCSIYNYVALSIVKFSSSTNRLLADGLRVFLVWSFALLAEWEYLNLITVMGFIILEMGTVSYRNAIFLEWYRGMLARWQRGRYVDLGGESGSAAAVPHNRAADII